MRSLGLLTLAALALAAPSSAAAIAVDDFTDPALAPLGGGLVTADTTGFGVQGGEPVAADAGCPARAKTGWWSLIGNGRPFTVATDVNVGGAPATTFDTIIAAYDAPGVSIGARLGCDGDQPGNAAAITVPTVRAQRYLVQVGGKNNAGGPLRLRFGFERPANDDRAAPLAIGTGSAATVDQTGATQEPGEVLSCGGSPYAGTVWFRYSAPEAVDARLEATAAFANTAAAGNTVMAVYRTIDTAPLACDDDSGGPAGGSVLALRLAPGDYLVQIGARGADGPALGVGPVTLAVADRDRDRDGALAPGDCNDLDAAIRPGATDAPGDGIDQDCAAGDAVDLDRDRDGFPRPADCNDDRADVNPGRVDRAGDRVDDDCRDGAAPFTPLTVGITGFFRALRTHTRVVDLFVRGVPAGARIVLRCGPARRGCPPRRTLRTFRVARARSDLLAGVRRSKLRPGARLELTVTRPGFIGLVTSWTIRAAKAPLRRDQCLPPGAKRPRSCPR